MAELKLEQDVRQQQGVAVIHGFNAVAELKPPTRPRRVRGDPRHPRLQRRGRIEATKPRRNVPATLPVIHGFNAVAELKPDAGGRGGRGRGLIHGFNAVAELKRR